MARYYRYRISFFNENCIRRRDRTAIRNFSNALSLPENEFLANYKISKEMVEYLCEELRQDLAPRTSQGLPVLVKSLDKIRHNLSKYLKLPSVDTCSRYFNSKYYHFKDIMTQNDNENSKILYRLLAACKKEQESGQLIISLDKCSERVSNYTGLPVSVIEGVIGRVQDQENVFNLDKHILLMTSIKMVLKMFLEPTFEKVYESFTKNYKMYFTNDINTISAPDFFAQINSLHYELRKTKSNSYVLMENPQVTFERYHYLSKIKKHRTEKKNIYFIDEKVINEKLENRKLVNEKDITAANEYVFFLMMSSKGYEHGLFTTVASDDVYKRWIENIVIPMLKPCSLIVMTNCYLHDDAKKSIITEYDTKAKMWQWLRDHDVPSSTSMSKAELWDLIRKCTDTTKTKTVDKIFQYHGYEVLHLPSTFEEISPIEFMWEKIKTNPSLTNNTNIQSAKDNLYEYLSTLQLSVWSSFICKSFQVEEEIYNLDNEIENFFEIVCDIENYNTDLKCVCKNCSLLTPESNIKMED